MQQILKNNQDLFFSIQLKVEKKVKESVKSENILKIHLQWKHLNYRMVIPVNNSINQSINQQLKKVCIYIYI